MRTRIVVIGIGIALALAVLLGEGWLLGSQVGAWGCRQPGLGMPGNYGFPWGMHTFSGGILMFLFWGLIIGGIALLVAVLARQGTLRGETGELPLDILKRRYASGEIDREEFERMKELLSS